MGRPNLGRAHSSRPEKVQHHYVEAIGGSVALPALCDKRSGSISEHDHLSENASPTCATPLAARPVGGGFGSGLLGRPLGLRLSVTGRRRAGGAESARAASRSPDRSPTEKERPPNGLSATVSESAPAPSECTGSKQHQRESSQPTPPRAHAPSQTASLEAITERQVLARSRGHY